AEQQQLLGLWGQCAALRRRLQLPEKVPDAQLVRAIEPHKDAMRHISAGLQVARAAEATRPALLQDPAAYSQFTEQRDNQILEHFGTAVARDANSVDALL